MSRFKIIILSIIAMVAYTGVTALAQPGTATDPLVSQRYVDNRIAELEAQIEELSLLLTTLNQPSDAPQPETTPVPEVVVASTRELFEVVHAQPGTVLIGGASTEIILRSGQATVVAGPNGLANVTTGVDVMNQQNVHQNHLLIVPQDDGRGLYFQTEAYLMVKGDFYIIGG